MARTWSAVLARTGVPTGDGRILVEGAGTGRSLPLPISWQERSDNGHLGSIVVARMESLQFANGMVTATGTMLDDIPYKVIEELEAGVIGPSVDLDDLEYVMDEMERIVVTKWRVAGATLVAIPAFSDVSLTLDPMPAEPMVPDGYVDYPAYSASLAAFALTAAAAPAEKLPPAGWFSDPGFTELTPLTVTEDGRVFGHIAAHDTCHVGLPGCVTAPYSSSGYAHFHVGAQRTQEGATVPVGSLVTGPSHAAPGDPFRAAQQHYDDIASAVAKVCAYDDEFGIAVTGWINPYADQARVDQFMSLPVSGDWRPIGGELELIAVCSVNTPGFPVPRARVAFSNGAQQSLIGTFGVTPVRGPVPEQVAPKDDGSAERARWAWQTRGH
jgi:hypothetical protein